MRRPRLHRSSVVAGLVAAALLVLVSVPGRVVGGLTSDCKIFEHGWPWVYLRRETIEEPVTFYDASSGLSLVPCFLPAIYPFDRDAPSRLPMWGVPWLTPANWMIWDGDANGDRHWHLMVGALLLDLATALGVVAIAVAATEVWRRRRARVLSFRIADMLVATAVLGAILGRIAYWQHEYPREQRALVDADGFSWYGQSETCIAPLWLRSLIGDRFFPDFCWRTATVLIHAGSDDADEAAQRISQLAYVHEIQVWLTEGESFRFSVLNAIPQLQTLEIDAERPIQERDVKELAQIVHLRKLVFWRKDEVPAELMARLESALPDCEIVDDDENW